jgi:peptidoglycan/xylan/chitin deacetylase (PgdA/CDA1 family)
LLAVLSKFDVKATVFTSGLMAELFPDTLKEALELGHEIACHHWDQSRHPFDYDDKEEERQALVRSIKAIEKATGCARSATCRLGLDRAHSPSSLPRLWVSLNGDYCDSDVPIYHRYWRQEDCFLGYVSPSYTDNDLTPLGLSGALQQLRDEFDAHYDESKTIR